jgi:acetyltransferase-like isoleucine patch superfamily enzyme
MTSFYSITELDHIGFCSVGSNVFISKKASFYGASRISIGNNVRIDDFCVLSAGIGGIKLGNYIHIGIYSSLVGEAAIEMEDFSGLSSRVSIYSSNDDYSGEYMSNPTVPQKFTSVYSADVLLCKHSLVGSGSIILPGVTLNQGAVVGALSLINKDCESFYIYKGSPAKKIIKRKNNVLTLEDKLLKSFD